MSQQTIDLDAPEQPSQAQKKGPVICLGMTFEDDKARRTYFTEQLRKKLKDPEFRKIEGFPIGEDEDLLNLSDPPYYTVCPNPWIADFIAEWEAEKPEQEDDYHREPFATDVKEGKNHPIYNAHSYHTKVPHRAIMRYILHYTNPGDIVFDGFCGTGMTGVAAQLCGDREEVLALGYKIQLDGTLLQQETDKNGKTFWKSFSKLGARKAVLNDLSPAATFIAYNYTTPVDVAEFEKKARCILKKVEEECGWMYETLHTDGKTKGKMNYTVWSDVYGCPECSGELVYSDLVFIKSRDGITDFNPEFCCPNCNVLISKNPDKNSSALKPIRLFVSEYDSLAGEVTKVQRQLPVLINYSVGTKRYEKLLDRDDLLKALQKVDENNIQFLPRNEVIEGEKSADPFSCGIRYVNQFYVSRTLNSLGIVISKIADNKQLSFLLGSTLPKLTKMNRYMPQHGGRALVGPMANTLYIPPISVENNVVKQLIFQFKKIIQALSEHEGSIITNQAIQEIEIPKNTMDYLFFDPPFGSNIMYSELSYIRESWLKVLTNNKLEAIESKVQKKNSDIYRGLMTESFKKAYKVLKPGRWMTVEFSNTKSAVWNSIQSALSDAGFIVASVAALDKTRGGFHAMIGTTAVKQDLVISAYKPSSEFETRFEQEAQTEEGVWDFIRTHLSYLPVTKLQANFLQIIPERDPRILYDQVIAFYVRKGFPVPLNSGEFQLGLSQRFEERDGMYFLPEQTAEYDRKKMQSGGMTATIEMFVKDEASMIDWLRTTLKQKPQTFADLNPQFMQHLGGWSKNEAQLDLRELLNQNFLSYDSTGPVPEQIHAYLSSNWKEMRSLAKDDSKLGVKA
jgi:DNA modification methylase